MLSLKVVLGFFHGIAKWGDCKVEFNQPFCWLYFMPNLLVIQNLETPYLGGIHVRAVCERVWRNAQECALSRASWLDLATGKSPKLAHVWGIQRSWRVMPVGALQDKTSNLARQLTHDSNSRLRQVARSNSQTMLFERKLTFRIPNTHQYK